MKKIIIIALLLVFTVTTSSYAWNFIEYKKVLLCTVRMYVLVNRFTGEVKYVFLNNGQLKLLEKGAEKNRYQSMYRAQIKLKLKCE